MKNAEGCQQNLNSMSNNLKKSTTIAPKRKVLIKGIRVVSKLTHQLHPIVNKEEDKPQDKKEIHKEIINH